MSLGDSDELVEVDPFTFAVGRHIKTDPRPHGLAASPDGSKVYLASDRTGNFQVVDVRLGKVIEAIPVGNDPNQMTLTRDRRVSFVPLRGDDQIAVVQLSPLAVLKKIPSPRRPHDAYTSADGRERIYVGTLAGNTISVFVPIVVFVLSRIGIVTPGFLLRQFKFAVLGAFIISAVITPTADVVNQTLLALPMLGLYLLGVFIAFLFGRKRRRPDDVSAGG